MSLIINDGNEYRMRVQSGYGFGNEQASLVERMALRCIPGYAEMLNLHANLTREHINRGRRAHHVVVDVGVHPGTAFYKTLGSVLGFDLQQGPEQEHGVRCLSVSPHDRVLSSVSQALPFVEPRRLHGHQLFESLREAVPGGADVIVMHHYLQSVPKSFKEPTIKAAYKLLRKNGIILVAQKEATPENIHKMVEDEVVRMYDKFLYDNGYSPGDVDIKAKSLKGSMWLSSGQSLRNLLYRCGFDKYVEITRWLQFSSGIAVKG